jgi:flotillin
VLNGSDGLSEIAAGLVSQGMAILDSVRKGMPVPNPQGTGDNGRVLGQISQESPGSAAAPGGSGAQPRG